MSIKLSDSSIGKDVQVLGQQIELASKAAQTQAPEALAPVPGDMFTAGGMTSLAEIVEKKAVELKAKLDEVRGMLGATAVEILMQTLPAAAVKALEALNADLPVKPGESVYLAYKTKMRELMALEMEVQAAHKHFRGGINEWAWGSQDSRDGPTLKEQGQVLSALQHGSTPAQLKAQSGAGSMGAYYVDKAQQTVDHYNTGLLKLWPDAPKAYLIRNTDGKTGGDLTVDRYFKIFYGNSRYSNAPKDTTLPDASLEAFRAQYPGYVALQKQVVALKQHVRAKALPTPEDVAVLRADALDPKKTSMQDLYREVAKAIGELDSFAESNQIKRETTKKTTKTTIDTYSEGSSSSEHRVHGVKVGSDFSSSSAESHTQIDSVTTMEQLNVLAREYVVELSAPFERLPYKDIKGSNFLTPTDRDIFAEKLLTTRRIYEAMLVREPDSAYTLALKVWMEDSTFGFKTKETDRDGWRTETKSVGTLHMSNLRQDLLAFAKSGFYPAERVAFLQEEMSLGLAAPKSKLGGVRSLSEI